LTTSQLNAKFNSEYLRNGNGNAVDNRGTALETTGGLPTVCRNFVNFAPQTAKRRPPFYPPSVIAALCSVLHLQRLQMEVTERE